MNRFLFMAIEADFSRPLDQDYVLVYAKSSWAEQSTPSYIRIVDSDMPVTDVIWVGEDSYLKPRAPLGRLGDKVRKVDMSWLEMVRSHETSWMPLGTERDECGQTLRMMG